MKGEGIPSRVSKPCIHIPRNQLERRKKDSAIVSLLLISNHYHYGFIDFLEPNVGHELLVEREEMLLSE